MRLASIEFYENKQVDENFDVASELTIFKILFAFALLSIELVFVFAYARIYGSITHSPLLLFVILMLINGLISIPLFNRIRDTRCIEDTLKRYKELDYAGRKQIYSKKNIALATILYAMLPWVFMGICIYIIQVLTR